MSCCKNKNDKSKKNKLCGFGYADYIIAASTIAIALGEDFNETDLSILSSFFATLSDELSLIASVMACNSDDDTNEEVIVPHTSSDTRKYTLDTHHKKMKKQKIKKVKKLKNKRV